MSDNMQLEKLIIESVIKELAGKGMLKGDGVAAAPQAAAAAVCSSGDEITLPPVDGIYTENVANMEAMIAMKKSTPARIGIGRTGARPLTASWLRLLADHAMAVDAVFLDVSDELLQKMNLFRVRSQAANKDEFLTRPELGRKLSDEALKLIDEKCVKNPQVQICVVDGLSSSAIEANIPDLLPALMQGLTAAGVKLGTPFFIENGRVWAQDPACRAVNADVVISLIGERPGLVTSNSLSAYIIYRPDENTVEADRTVVSNIHSGGIPPAEAGAHLATLVKEILDAKASGVKFQAIKHG